MANAALATSTDQILTAMRLLTEVVAHPDELPGVSSENIASYVSKLIAAREHIRAVASDPDLVEMDGMLVALSPKEGETLEPGVISFAEWRARLGR